MTFKQKYLHEKGPFPFDFQQERNRIYSKILQSITQTNPNSWAHYAINPSTMVDGFKQIYGLQASQLTEITNILVSLFFNNKNLCGQSSILILKTLNRAKEYEIQISDKLTVSNKLLLGRIQNMYTSGNPFPPKSCDQFLQQFIKFILRYSRYGDDCVQPIIQLAIKKKEIKIIGIFIESIKEQASAHELIQILFIESSLWERDIWWFYIISKLTKKFAHLNYTPYHYTLFHQTIKIFTTLIEPLTDEDVKKLLNYESSLNIPSIFSSVAKILTHLLISQNCEPIWSCIERLFSLIKSSLDHVTEQPYISDFFIFIRQFVKSFISIYRIDRKQDLKINQDYIQIYNGSPESFKLDQSKLQRFYKIWPQIIPKLLYFEDQQLSIPKILSQLAMFNPTIFLSTILNSILQFLQKDLTLVSLNTSKTTILFLEEFIIYKFLQEHEMSLLIECCNSFLLALQKLGISQNIDTLQLIMRMFTYLPNNYNNTKIQTLIEDLLDVVIKNLNAISINLDQTDSEQSQIYVEFKNFFFPFFFRLSTQQINLFTDKFLYKLREAIPSHKGAYEMLTTVLCYTNHQVPKKIVDFVYKSLVDTTPQKQNKNGAHNPIIENQRYPEQSKVNDIFPLYPDKTLNTKNQENVTWYSSLLQTAVEYSPTTIIEKWEKIETVLIVMFKQWQNTTFFQKGLDLLFNIILGLNRVHLNYNEFKNDDNRNYDTLNIKWVHTSEDGIKLLDTIYKRYYLNLKQFLQNRYNSVLKGDSKIKKLQSNDKLTALSNHIKIKIQVKQKYSVLLDQLITPPVPNSEDLDQKKLVYKIISIQYTVFSALLLRAPYTPPSHPIQELTNFFLPYPNLRTQACSYCEWLIELLSFYNCLWDPSTLKVLHYLWRQAHDQFYFSSLIATTNQKLGSYYYPQMNKKKQLFHCAFLILNEAYLLYVSRLQFLNQIYPTAYLNNPNFTEKMVPFSFCSSLQSTFKTILPPSFNPHQFHQELLALCRLKLSPTHSQSYLFKYINVKQKNEKQKYISAIRFILNHIKKYQALISNQCCIRDQTSWYAILQILQVYPNLQNKTDKIIFLEVVYLMLSFNFDYKGIYTFKTGESSQNFNEELLSKMKIFCQTLIRTVEERKEKKYISKNKQVMVLMILIFSQFFQLTDSFMLEIIQFVIEICLISSIQINNIARTFLFRIINRFLKNKTFTKHIQNVPVKRKFDDFIVYRYLGGYDEKGKPFPLQKYPTQKLDNFFYPLKSIRVVQNDPLNDEVENEKVLLSFLNDENKIRQLISIFSLDTSLKASQTEDVSYLTDEESKRINSNGHKLVNFILDSNPLNVQIFSNFVDNFSSYPVCFYQRLFRKIIKIGNQKTILNLKSISLELLASTQTEQLKLGTFLSIQLIPTFLNDQAYIKKFIQFLVTCTNEHYQFANACFLILFSNNFMMSQKIYKRIIVELRKEKGTSRLRHLSFFNNYILCQGRFGRKDAIQGIGQLLKGINEGSSEVSDLIVTMLLSCFIISINIQNWSEWIQEPIQELVKTEKIFKLDQWTGYQIEPSLKQFLKQISNKTQLEKEMQSKNLKIYSKIVYQILGSITVFRFNHAFYDILKGMILYVLNKPSQTGSNDEEILSHLKDSEYPFQIFEDLLKSLKNMEGNSSNIVKKKIKFIQGLSINKSFCENSIYIPPFLIQNDKNITIDHIVSASNIARLMKEEELIKQVEKCLKEKEKNIYLLMTYLLASGVRPFIWRQQVLKQIIKVKKLKIVKEFVSAWWKGRSPSTQEEERLYRLVSNVENPYSYFA